MSEPDDGLSRSGILFALGAYVSWGFTPIFWKQLVDVPATEILAYRIVGALGISAGLVFATGQGAALRDVLRSRRQLLMLVASGLLLGVNWWVFIYAVNTDRIVDTSLGYYLTPLLNVAIGVLLFGERLERAQKIAVALAAVGVAYMAWDFGRLPWISLTLGISFAFYGAIRKSSPVTSLGGLTVETGALLLPSLAYLVWGGEGHGASDAALPTWTLGRPGLVLACGLLTAFPLGCFASAARRLPLSAVGIFQYIAPSLSLGVAVGLYGEPFTRVHAITFALIWCALALYTWNGFARARAA
jgi:chloramphenicol-sensitive protein RarD